MIGLDTSALIDLSLGDKKLIDILRRQNICVQNLVLMEFCAGAPESRWLEKIMDEYEVHEFASKDLLIAFKLLKYLRSLGQEIGIIDCCIVCVYMNRGITTIVTKNTKHFSRIPGLKIISY